MASLKYTRREVQEICRRMGLTISNEDATGCVAKKDTAFYRFEYITESDRKAQLAAQEAKKAAETKTAEVKVEEAVATEAPKKRRGRPPRSESTAVKKTTVKKKTTTTGKKRMGRPKKKVAEVAE